MGYLRFLARALWLSIDGSWRFYAWMIALTAVWLVGANAWAHQVADGMVVTNMSDHVSWGLYIANFTFTVGLAAGGVLMVIPAYLYKDREMHHVVMIGELVAIAAIVMSLAFVIVDLGRPDRLWHMIPGIGQFNWPNSMLTWDVIVLSVYLLLNLHVCGYILYSRFRGRVPNPRWYVPFVLLSIVWAISIHTVTAFLYAGLGGRPFWNSALLAPRFIVTAFIAGPAFIVVLLYGLRRMKLFHIADGPIRTLIAVMRVTVLINLFMFVSELFTELYAGGAHSAPLEYLFSGLDGHDALVPWVWTALFFNVLAAAMLFVSRPEQRPRIIVTACVLTFVGIWIEKGMGLIIPGFVPSTLHEVVEYVPSLTEWKVTAGIWAFGLMVLTIALKIAGPILAGRERAPDAPPLASSSQET
jgi:molybdopterin-containing oxidoreductase family membrane subunit